jgi:glyoxylase-like metal-dependent hydrolase (beta-lactamase superfamily II)
VVTRERHRFHVVRVPSNVHQILLENTAFEGRNAIYLLQGDGPTTLVDVGVSTPRTRAALDAALDAFDRTIADVERVVITHWHHDHSGLAGEIQDESGADVYVHEADAALVAHEEDAVAAYREHEKALWDEWGMPEDKQRALATFLERHDDIRGSPVDVTPVTEGDTIEAGDQQLEVVHLPGHAAGLCGFVFEREGRREAFVGDAILPKYTPNVGGADIRVDHPLAAYLSSLDRIVDLDLDRAWPGHRGCIFDPTGRALDIAQHHVDRESRVIAALETLGPATPWEVSAELFGTLEQIHIMHGPGEAYAHLDHLVYEGELVRDDDGRYDLA